MKILVLATNYPRPDGFVSLQYIHTRNKWYIEYGMDVSVVSFASETDYVLDGIKVFSLNTYRTRLVNEKYDLLVSHAPNIRNHYKFLKRFGKNFPSYVFFFHGHEVLRASKIYPKDYGFVKKASLLSRLIREVYDTYKLMFWRNFFNANIKKSQFIFVSNWMYEMFLKFIKIDPNVISSKVEIVYNSIGEGFEVEKYQHEVEKKYDFITIRTSLDGSKYGIDIVNRIAKENPQYSFCVIGKGEYFEHFDKAENLVWFDTHLNHGDIIRFLNESRCALLPTRADAQGVMACEIATFGMPLITSDIDVCKEVFSEFKNVRFIDNDGEDIDIESMFNDLLIEENIEVNEKYYSKNTIKKEVEVFNEILGKEISYE